MFKKRCFLCMVLEPWAPCWWIRALFIRLQWYLIILVQSVGIMFTLQLTLRSSSSNSISRRVLLATAVACASWTNKEHTATVIARNRSILVGLIVKNYKKSISCRPNTVLRGLKQQQWHVTLATSDKHLFSCRTFSNIALWAAADVFKTFGRTFYFRVMWFVPVLE